MLRMTPYERQQGYIWVEHLLHGGRPTRTKFRSMQEAESSLRYYGGRPDTHKLRDVTDEVEGFRMPKAA